MLLFLLLSALLFTGAAVLLARRPARVRVVTALVLLGCVGGSATALWLDSERTRASSRERVEGAVPELGRPAEGFATSGSCQKCHPDQYASWHAGYHRTMTTVASKETVRGDFTPQTLRARGRDYRIERRGDTFWVEMVDPDWERDLRLAGKDPDAEEDPPRVWRQIVMTTGSHHMQTYWVPSRYGREVYNVPWVFDFERQRWIPREDVFLRPPDAGRFFALWNNSCIDCHSTAGKVGFRLDQEVFDSQVAEIGIACEACHGPAQGHVEANRDPLRRYRLHLTHAADPSVVQPRRLDHRAASEVCGQCHGVSLADPRDWLEHGFRYRAGEELEASRFLVRPAVDNTSPEMQELLQQDGAAIDTRFWSDGMVRVSGREFSAMMESGCYQRGELSCLSCHSIHESDPNDLLAAGMEGDQACLQCHGEYAGRIEQHTHHPAESSGSRCYNCHMPNTTYGLLGAMRSHWIDSPSVASTLATGRPNACNLCHLDKTLAWTEKALAENYGIDPVALRPRDQQVANGVAMLLAGDAGQRALVAWSMGWEPAREASGRGWMVPYLASLLDDPYATVRYVAERSLRLRPGLADLDYDFVGPEQERVRAREHVLDLWFAQPVSSLTRTGPEILIDAQGNLDYPRLIELSKQRDDRPVVLAE